MLCIQFSRNVVLRLLPAFLVMLAIFLFSARPADPEPLSLLERILYKAGHVLGYAMLSLSYWRAMNFDDRFRPLAWILALMYAVSDEYHQSFVPGRHPTAFDVLVYDNFGSFAALWLVHRLEKQKQPDPQGLVVKRDS